MTRHETAWFAGQPIDERAQSWVGQQGITAVEVKRQLLLAEQAMNLIMARPTYPKGGRDSLFFPEALAHIGFAVKRLGDQMVACQGRVTQTEFTGIRLIRQPQVRSHLATPQRCRDCEGAPQKNVEACCASHIELPPAASESWVASETLTVEDTLCA